ncbi:MAG: 50S ribosomal protein L7/L12 [candidate division WOR-3 bacterium]|nr:MAG: 50S ribosomal protein L7/L12 [candidate division WOR-3 bacterium]
MAADKVQQVMEIVEGLKVTELARLVKELKEKFDIQAPVFAAGASPAAAGSGAPAEAAAEEKTDFTVVLTSVGDKKIQVLKELRALTQLGLKEAKEIIDKVPGTVKENVPKEEADKIKSKLEEVGAKVEVK